MEGIYQVVTAEIFPLPTRFTDQDEVIDWSNQNQRYQPLAVLRGIPGDLS
jgi:hypothetical protein